SMPSASKKPRALAQTSPSWLPESSQPSCMLTTGFDWPCVSTLTMAPPAAPKAADAPVRNIRRSIGIGCVALPPRACRIDRAVARESDCLAQSTAHGSVAEKPIPAAFRELVAGSSVATPGLNPGADGGRELRAPRSLRLRDRLA